MAVRRIGEVVSDKAYRALDGLTHYAYELIDRWEGVPEQPVQAGAISDAYGNWQDTMNGPEVPVEQLLDSQSEHLSHLGADFGWRFAAAIEDEARGGPTSPYRL